MNAVMELSDDELAKATVADLKRRILDLYYVPSAPSRAPIYFYVLFLRVGC